MASISHSKKYGQEGFTLLEVLIAMVILTFISVGIYQAITETYHLREILSNEGDFYNSIRLSMNILQRDVSLLYSPINAVPSPAPSGAQTGTQPVGQTFPGQPQIPTVPSYLTTDPDLAQTSDFWSPAIDKSGIRPSRFVGTETKITFVANSHLRVYRDTPESEFAKITYELITDEFDKESLMLVKTESTDIFQLEDRKDLSKRSYALLHGVKKLKFRFYQYDKDNPQWQPNWDSDSQEHKNLYPDIVEINFEVSGPSKLFFNGIYDFRPELPLNGIDPSS